MAEMRPRKLSPHLGCFGTRLVSREVYRIAQLGSNFFSDGTDSTAGLGLIILVARFYVF